MKNNKFFIIPFIAVLALLFIFVTTQIPSARQAVKNLPIALVVEDTGEMGQTLLTTIQEKSKAMQTDNEPMIKWVVLNTRDDMEQEMADQNIYGALVIPADFSQEFGSLQTATPTPPEIEIFINQGKNATVANVVSQTLTGMVTQMNLMMSEQLLTAMASNNMTLTVDQARLFTSPISSTTTMLHPTGTLGNAPVSLFQPLWMASLLSAVMLFFAAKNRVFQTKGDQLKLRLIQILVTIPLGFVAGYSLTWYTTFILDYSFESFHAVAVFLSITCISFILLITAVMAWIGMGGVGILALLMFFGAPLLQLAPEMLPEFYSDWINPWLPMRFMVEGVREILFFGGGSWNSSSSVLVWIAIVSILVILAKSLVSQTHTPIVKETDV